MFARLHRVVALLAVCVALLSGCKQQAQQPAAPADNRAADEATVRAASAEWAKAAAAKDLEKTLSYYAEDAAMFPPNTPIVRGPDERRREWTTLFSPNDLQFTNAATKVEASRSGDLAYETGTFEEWFKNDEGQPVKLTGKYVVVWKKQPGGDWKAVVDIFNTDQ